MSRKVIIVGLAPGKSSDEALHPRGMTGKRLADLCGLSDDEYLDRFTLMNLHPKADSGRDQEAAKNILPVLRGRRVVCLGRRVSDSLGTEMFKWGVSRGGFVGSSMPHPSGLNRWWNNPRNVTRARKFARSLLRPCIHVEGVDGSGKTTLIGEISDQLSLRRIETDDPPSTYSQCIRRISRRIIPGVVCDRSSGLVSELVYGKVIRGETLGGDKLWDILRSMIEAVTFVHCRSSPGPLEFREGEDPDHVEAVRKKLPLLRTRYLAVMRTISSMGGRVVDYDWRKEDLISCVESLRR